MNKIVKIHLLLIVTLLTGCAQITAPTGGKKDEIPPELNQEKTFPKNYSTSFTGNKIVLTFDEYFVLKNPQNNVFISPVLEEKPTFLVKGKTLTIDLKNELKENTTYTINFGDAISDYTVGNKIPDFKYVFSTGEFIDSMEFVGNVKDILTQTGEEDVLVLLYNTFEDSIVSNSAPTYFAKTNKEGEYSFKYIKEGKYKLFALKDENRNYKYDLPNEKTAFLDTLIVLKSDTSKNKKTQNISLNLFEKNYKKQQISSKKYTFPGKLTLIFEKSAKNVEIINLDTSEFKYNKIEKSKEGDTVIIWKTDSRFDKTNLIVKADSFTDTIKIYNFKKPRKDTGLHQVSSSNQIDVGSSFSTSFDRPLQSMDTSKILIYKDSVIVKVNSFKIENNILKLNFNTKEKDRIRYEILPNAIKDIFGFANSDTLKGFIAVREKDYYGTFILEFKPKNDSANYIVFLLNESGNVLRKENVIGSKKIRFEKLLPGKYSAKAVLDKNKNGKWDTGDYYKKLQPEPVFFFVKQIELRSNWEMEEEFIF